MWSGRKGIVCVRSRGTRIACHIKLMGSLNKTVLWVVLSENEYCSYKIGRIHLAVDRKLQRWGDYII